jgi:hypothetical protein
MVYGTQITIVIGAFVNQLSYLGGPTLSEFQNDEMRFGIVSSIPVRHPKDGNSTAKTRWAPAAYGGRVSTSCPKIQ